MCDPAVTRRQTPTYGWISIAKNLWGGGWRTPDVSLCPRWRTISHLILALDPGPRPQYALDPSRCQGPATGHFRDSTDRVRSLIPAALKSEARWSEGTVSRVLSE